MNQLFNKTFFRFALGFVGVLMLSFALAVALTHIDRSSPVIEETVN